MKRISVPVVAVVVVLSVISGVECGFGLSVTAPSVTSGIAGSIGNAISTLVRANASIKVEAGADASGTIGNLFIVANNVTNPMNKLLGSIVAAASSKNPNVSELFNNISTLISQTSSALDAAAMNAANLQSTIKNASYQEITNNIADLKNVFANLTQGLDLVRSQITLAAMAQYPPTSSNVTIYLNRTVVGNLTTPLRAIKGYLTNIAVAITTIGVDRTQAIAYQTQMNETISAGIKNIASAAVSYNRTVADVYVRISNQQVSTFRAINQSYVSILTRADHYNGGDISNLTQFLADMSSANASFGNFVELSTNYSTDQVASALQEQVDIVVATLLNITANITNMGATNSSPNAASCTGRAMSQLQQGQIALGRFSTCMQAESGSFRPMVQFVQVQMDHVRNAGSQIAVQMSRMCTTTNGPCAASFFAALPSHSERIQNKISALASGVTNDEHIVTGRIVDCLTGAGADIQYNAQNVQSAFGTCLAAK